MRRNERGTVTAAVVILAVSLLAVAGLVFDGGNVLAARRRALNEAEAAARAGAQAVDMDRLRSGAVVEIDPAGAERRALDHLAAAGHQGTVVVEGDLVRVHVALRQPLSILGAFGLGAVTVEGDGEARAVRGVTRGDD